MPGPPRLRSLSIQDFGAFPGQGNPPIELNGKNLLVYGENGAGKSSIYKALDGLLSFDPSILQPYKDGPREGAHIFTPEAERRPSVEAEYDDDITVRWDTTNTPLTADEQDRLHTASYRKGMLDYRSLLDVSYRFIGEDVNLFDACVNVLLEEYEIPHLGSQKPISDLWKSVKQIFSSKHDSFAVSQLNVRLNSLNAGLALVIPSVVGETNTLLRMMTDGEVNLRDLELQTLVFRHHRERRRRKITGQDITPVVELHGQRLDHPHTLLNEARVSALSIALYLAGRKLCAQTFQDDAPKLLVLDDLLIGLDQNNRLPVLDVLKTHFANWQIILMTHDKVWFDMACAHLPQSGANAWTALEIFEKQEPNGRFRPLQRPRNSDGVTNNISQACNFLADNYPHAASVHARMAFELSLKKVCEKKGIKVKFNKNPRRVSSDDLLTALKSWLGGDPSRAAKKTSLDPHITAVEAARSVVLNPFSHATPVTLTQAEVAHAVTAVEDFYSEARTQLLDT